MYLDSVYVGGSISMRYACDAGGAQSCEAPTYCEAIGPPSPAIPFGLITVRFRPPMPPPPRPLIPPALGFNIMKVY